MAVYPSVVLLSRLPAAGMDSYCWNCVESSSPWEVGLEPWHPTTAMVFSVAVVEVITAEVYVLDIEIRPSYSLSESVHNLYRSDPPFLVTYYDIL